MASGSYRAFLQSPYISRYPAWHCLCPFSASRPLRFAMEQIIIQPVVGAGKLVLAAPDHGHPRSLVPVGERFQLAFDVLHSDRVPAGGDALSRFPAALAAEARHEQGRALRADGGSPVRIILAGLFVPALVQFPAAGPPEVEQPLAEPKNVLGMVEP